MSTYLVVGATKGIGRKVAEMLSENHIVIGFARNSDDTLENVKQYEIDVTSSDNLPDLTALDGIVYCPGTINLKPFNRLSAQDFTNDFSVNVLGAVSIIQKYLPLLKNSKNASIVLFSTVAVSQGMPFHASIATAKAGVEGLTRSLAAELAPLIRVNAIAPSLTDTSLASGLLNTESKLQSAEQRHPLKKIGSAEILAKSAIHLLTEASFTTGQVMAVDGGLSRLRV
jgi:3-oxoacyl-[acyl-carrier protein] reductase